MRRIRQHRVLRTVTDFCRDALPCFENSGEKQQCDVRLFHLRMHWPAHELSYAGGKARRLWWRCFARSSLAGKAMTWRSRCISFSSGVVASCRRSLCRISKYLPPRWTSQDCATSPTLRDPLVPLAAGSFSQHDKQLPMVYYGSSVYICCVGTTCTPSSLAWAPFRWSRNVAMSASTWSKLLGC